MNLNTILKTAALAALIGTGTQALAGTSVSAAYPETVAAAVQDLGYKANLTTDSYGDPQVRSASDGVNFTLTFYGCDNNGEYCQDIQFSAAFDMSYAMDVKSVNTWNRERAMGKAFLDDEMDPALQHYMISVDGMSRAVFQESFEYWIEILSDFTDFIDW